MKIKLWHIEVKMPDKDLNKKQVEFVDKWQGQFIVIRTIEQAKRFAREIKE